MAGGSATLQVWKISRQSGDQFLVVGHLSTRMDPSYPWHFATLSKGVCRRPTGKMHLWQEVFPGKEENWKSRVAVDQGWGIFSSSDVLRHENAPQCLAIIKAPQKSPEIKLNHKMSFHNEKSMEPIKFLLKNHLSKSKNFFHIDLLNSPWGPGSGIQDPIFCGEQML